MNCNFRYLELICILCLVLTSGCSTVKGLFGDDDEEPTISEDISARQLYTKANGELNGNRFADAIESYTLLESRYPFGKYAQQAQLELAFLYYRQSNMDAAISSADRFIKLNPQHPHVDYAYYMKGLANFDKSKTFLNFILPRNPSDKDPAPLIAAFDIFSSLIQKYPDCRKSISQNDPLIHLQPLIAQVHHLHQLHKHQMPCLLFVI